MKTAEEIKNLFIQFLVKEGIKEQFDRNRECKEMNLEEDNMHTLSHGGATRLVSSEFDWESSPEKYQFWYNINAEWKSYLNKRL